MEVIRRELLECLHTQLTTELSVQFESHLLDFANALNKSDIRSLLRVTTLFHNAVRTLASCEDANYLCDLLQELIPSGLKTVAQPLACKELHFIWIGCIGIRSLRNISVWKRANPLYRVHLWFDSHCLLASHYRQLLKQRMGLNLSTDELVSFQNRIYIDLQSMIAGGRTFDEALIHLLLRMDDGRIGRKLESELEQARRLYQALAHHFTLRDVQDYVAVIMDREFRQYYSREITLRGNLAAASDILRLHVIQHFGGVYVDCDTLPNLDHVFVRTGAYCRHHNITFSFIDVLKSEMYMQKIAPLVDLPEFGDEPENEANARQSDMNAITDHLRSQYGKVVTFIEQDVDALIAENAFRPLNEIWLFDQGLLLTGDPHNKNSFNNNVVIANAHSKAVKIVLLEMRHRYRYLERMGVVYIASAEELPLDNSYKGRLLNYRFDALDDRHNVTVILTGPGLILEVVMGLGFSLLRLDDQVAPISLSYALYSQKIGIAFMDQTFHTYDHFQSTWMRGND